MSFSMNRKRKLGHISVGTKNFVLNEMKLELGGDQYDAFISIMKSVITAGKTSDALSHAVRNLNQLLNGYPNLIVGLNSFLPTSHQLIIHPHHQEEFEFEFEGNDHILEPMIDFMNKVKLRFIRRNPAIYTQFLDLLNSNPTLDDHPLCHDICALLRGHPDLQRTFTALINIDDHHMIENQGLSLCHNVKEKLAHNSGDYLKFLKLLHDHASGDITSVELQMCFADLVHNCPILLDQLASFLQACERNADEQRKNNKAKVTEEKPIKIRLKNRKPDHDDGAINPSYQPKKMITRCEDNKSSSRSVLNESWVCVPSASASASTSSSCGERREIRRSQQQEIMFEWEDELFELSMLIEKLKSIIMANANGTSTAVMRCSKQLSASQLKCIKDMYGEKGEDIVRLMDQKPRECLPLIIKRLHQKQHEWTNEVRDLLI